MSPSLQAILQSLFIHCGPQLVPLRPGFEMMNGHSFYVKYISSEEWCKWTVAEMEIYRLKTWSFSSTTACKFSFISEHNAYIYINTIPS